MRKLYLLLVGLLLLIGCSSPEPEMMELTTEDEEVSESRGVEQAARATPLPPRDKATPFAVSDAAILTQTETLTPTLPISTTVRGEIVQTVAESRPDSFHCSAAAQHAIYNED